MAVCSAHGDATPAEDASCVAAGGVIIAAVWEASRADADYNAQPILSSSPLICRRADYGAIVVDGGAGGAGVRL